MSRKPRLKSSEDERYEVTVWDHDGNIVKKLWDASYDETEEVRGQYDDEPLMIIDVRERF
jgi:hypothetical protein